MMTHVETVAESSQGGKSLWALGAVILGVVFMPALVAFGVMMLRH